MSISTLVLADNTPANHDYTPEQDGLRAIWVNREGATSAAHPSCFIGINRATNNRPTDKITGNLRIPYTHTVDEAVRIRDTSRFNLEAVLSKDSTVTEREHAWALFKSFVNTTEAEDAFVRSTPAL